MTFPPHPSLLSLSPSFSPPSLSFSSSPFILRSIYGAECYMCRKKFYDILNEDHPQRLSGGGEGKRGMSLEL